MRHCGPERERRGLPLSAPQSWETGRAWQWAGLRSWDPESEENRCRWEDGAVEPRAAATVAGGPAAPQQVKRGARTSTSQDLYTRDAHPREGNTYVHVSFKKKKIAALFIMGKKWTRARRPSADRFIKDGTSTPRNLTPRRKQ